MNTFWVVPFGDLMIDCKFVQRSNWTHWEYRIWEVGKEKKIVVYSNEYRLPEDMLYLYSKYASGLNEFTDEVYGYED